jgi:hypothetical protein
MRGALQYAKWRGFMASQIGSVFMKQSGMAEGKSGTLSRPRLLAR